VGWGKLALGSVAVMLTVGRIFLSLSLFSAQSTEPNDSCLNLSQLALCLGVP
jgi:hypothetical protein